MLKTILLVAGFFQFNAHAQGVPSGPRLFSCYHRLTGVMDIQIIHVKMKAEADGTALCRLYTVGGWGGKEIGTVNCSVSYNELGQAVIASSDDEFKLVVHTDRPEVELAEDGYVSISTGKHTINAHSKVQINYPGRMTIRMDYPNGEKKFETFKMGCTDSTPRIVKINEVLDSDTDAFEFVEGENQEEGSGN